MDSYSLRPLSNKNIANIRNRTSEYTLEKSIPEIIAFEKSSIESATTVKFHNVLITSSSSKIPLIREVKTALKKIDQDIKLFGSDSDSKALSQHFVDEFWNMPKLSDLTIDELINYCKSNNIRLIIPTRDGELTFFSEQKNTLEKNAIFVMISELEAIEKCLDKRKFSAIPNIDAIPSYTDLDQCPEPVVLKERFDAGALSISLNIDKATAMKRSTELINPIYQPYISGQEISVDAYITKKKTVKGVIIRTRDEIINGESRITTTLQDNKLEQKFKSIFEQLHLYGHVMLQAIIDQDINIHVIECNPRFGGASTLSIKAGLDSFYWAYLESLGNDITEYPFLKAKNIITQIRFPEDIYI